MLFVADTRQYFTLGIDVKKLCFVTNVNKMQLTSIDITRMDVKKSAAGARTDSQKSLTLAPDAGKYLNLANDARMDSTLATGARMNLTLAAGARMDSTLAASARMDSQKSLFLARMDATLAASTEIHSTDSARMDSTLAAGARMSFQKLLPLAAGVNFAKIYLTLPLVPRWIACKNYLASNCACKFLQVDDNTNFHCRNFFYCICSQIPS